MPKLADYDPLFVETDSSLVNTVRDALETAPVLVGEYLVQIDDRSEKRMQQVIEFWHVIKQETINWTMADNTVHSLTKKQLGDILMQAREARALRALELHTEAKVLKSNSKRTVRDLKTWENSHGASVVDQLKNSRVR